VAGKILDFDCYRRRVTPCLLSVFGHNRSASGIDISLFNIVSIQMSLDRKEYEHTVLAISGKWSRALMRLLFPASTLAEWDSCLRRPHLPSPESPSTAIVLVVALWKVHSFLVSFKSLSIAVTTSFAMLRLLISAAWKAGAKKGSRGACLFLRS
jgi:hypothetical protein